MVQDLGDLRRMALADGKDDRLADLATDGIAEGILKEGLAEKLVGRLGEEALFEFALGEALLGGVPLLIFDGRDIAFIGEELGGDIAPGIDDGGIDEESVLHSIE